MSESAHATVIVADDHPLFREALSHAIEQCLPGARIVEADSLETLQTAVEAHAEADLLLLDLHMPGAQGFSALVYLRGQYESLPTVMVSASEDARVIRSELQFGRSHARYDSSLTRFIASTCYLPPRETIICVASRGRSCPKKTATGVPI